MHAGNEQRACSVYSLNYDFVPTIAYGDKCFWADLKWPAPESLKIGSPVRFVSFSEHLILPGPQSLFKITDIVGSRVVIAATIPGDSAKMLTYFKQKMDRPDRAWSPLDHGANWGYATRNLADPNPAADRNWTYGNGDSVLTMIW